MYVVLRTTQQHDESANVQYKLFQQAAIARMLGAILEHASDCDQTDLQWFQEAREGLAAAARGLADACTEVGEGIRHFENGGGR